MSTRRILPLAMCFLPFVLSSCPATDSLPDLVAEALTIAPANPTPEEQITVSAGLTNGGQAAASNFVWDITLDGIEIATNTVAALGAGESLDEIQATFGPVEAGSHRLDFSVDRAGEVEESLENNNTQGPFVFTVQVIESVLPSELWVYPGRVYFESTETTKSVAIANVGQGDLSWSASTDGASWLELLESNGTNNFQLDIRATRGVLPDGIYDETLRITSEGGNVDVPIAMFVGEEFVADGQLGGVGSVSEGESFTLMIDVPYESSSAIVSLNHQPAAENDPSPPSDWNLTVNGVFAAERESARTGSAIASFTVVEGLLQRGENAFKFDLVADNDSTADSFQVLTDSSISIQEDVAPEGGFRERGVDPFEISEGGSFMTTVHVPYASSAASMGIHHIRALGNDRSPPSTWRLTVNGVLVSEQDSAISAGLTAMFSVGEDILQAGDNTLLLELIADTDSTVDSFHVLDDSFIQITEVTPPE